MLKKRSVSVVLVQLLCLSVSLMLVSVTLDASCVSDNEMPLLDGGIEYNPPAWYEFEPEVRPLLEEKDQQINSLSRQVEELQAVNYQTTIMMYVFVVVSAVLVLMLMFLVMLRRPTLIVRTTR